MKRCTVLLVALAALALPQSVLAKGEITGAKLCGTNGCEEVSTGSGGGDGSGTGFFMTDPTDLPPPGNPAPGSFYRLQLRMSDADETTFLLPIGVAGTVEGWFRLPPALLRELRPLMAEIQPFPFRLDGVFVNYHRVSDPDAYLPVLGLHGGRLLASQAYPHASRWFPVDFRTDGPTPWTAIPLSADYDPVLGAVSISGQRWTPVPPALRELLDAAGHPHTAAPTSSSGSPWAPIGA